MQTCSSFCCKKQRQLIQMLAGNKNNPSLGHDVHIFFGNNPIPTSHEKVNAIPFPLSQFEFVFMLRYPQDELVYISYHNPILLYIYCLRMRTLKESATSFQRTTAKPPPHEKVLKKSDIKLNDVLINGVRLRCFKNIKNRYNALLRQSPLQQRNLKGCKKIEEEPFQEDTIFKNKAIKKRLKSLQIEPLSVCRTNYENFNPKKTFTPYQQFHKMPIQILKPTPKSNSQPTQSHPQPHEYKLLDINQKYYSQLKKELMMYSTNSRFNSTTIKNRIEFGKYIGLKSQKHKRYVSERESNLIQQKISRFDHDNYPRHHRSVNTEMYEFHFEMKEKDAAKTHYQSIQKIEADSSTHKLKICYSTKHQLKRWRQYMNQNIKTEEETCQSVVSDLNPEEKLRSTLAQP